MLNFLVSCPMFLIDIFGVGDQKGAQLQNMIEFNTV